MTTSMCGGGMGNRKIFCEVLDAMCYEDRCLFKLSKIIEGNKTCEECILHEVERLKSGSEKPKAVKMPIEKKKRPGPRDRGGT